MSNSFYQKGLTETQWSRIKFVFEEKVKIGRLPVNRQCQADCVSSES